MSQTSIPEPKWAIVEQMGHVRYAALVSKDDHFGTDMLRADVLVDVNPHRFVSKLLSTSAIFAITIVDEAIAEAVCIKHPSGYAGLRSEEAQFIIDKAKIDGSIAALRGDDDFDPNNHDEDYHFP